MNLYEETFYRAKAQRAYPEFVNDLISVFGKNAEIPDFEEFLVWFIDEYRAARA